MGSIIHDFIGCSFWPFAIIGASASLSCSLIGPQSIWVPIDRSRSLDIMDPNIHKSVHLISLHPHTIHMHIAELARLILRWFSTWMALSLVWVDVVFMDGSEARLVKVWIPTDDTSLCISWASTRGGVCVFKEGEQPGWDKDSAADPLCPRCPRVCLRRPPTPFPLISFVCPRIPAPVGDS